MKNDQSACMTQTCLNITSVISAVHCMILVTINKMNHDDPQFTISD